MIKEIGSLPAGMDLPAVLLPYQQRLCKMMDTASVVFCSKSRRIGMTWGIASYGVLTSAARKSAGGMDTFYIGFNLDMTKEFIDTAAEWAKAFSYAAESVEEFLFVDIDENGNTKQIQAFRIKFDSGYAIVALTSRPRSLRGRQGFVIIDEAAFHDNLEELMKAALAFLIWGGKVLVISTHDGVNNPFNKYISDIKAGRSKYALIEVGFDDALREGLYRRICLTKGEEWSAEAEAIWRQEIIDFYGDGADEELFCIPKLSSGAFLPSVLIESRMEDVPVLRLSCPDDFVLKPEYERERFVQDWCERELKPLLDVLPTDQMHVFGEDFGRSGDLTIFWPMTIEKNMKRRTPFLVELRNAPFDQQEQVCWYILDRLPRFVNSAFDGRGNGQALAEKTMQRYGLNRVNVVMISLKWYCDAFPKYKAAFEDDMISIPRDDDILTDHRIAVMARGIPQIPEPRTKGKDGGKRHGDSLVAGAMAYWASLQDFAEYDYIPAGIPREVSKLRPDHSDDHGPRGIYGVFGNQRGAW